MKILFNDLIPESTITSLNASENYPAENLQSFSIRERYQSTIVNDTLTIELGADYNISSFFYAYTNATAMSVRFYDYDSSLLYTLAITAPGSETEHEQFTTIQDVYYIEIDLTATTTEVYLGAVGVGVAYTMPDPLSTWTEPYFDSSAKSRSRAGLALHNYIKPFWAGAFGWGEITRTLMNEIIELVTDYGTGAPIWIDCFELNHTFMKPYRATIENMTQPKKTDRRYAFTLTFKEAR